MTEVYDGDARVLPRPADERATVTAWQAWSVCSADLRAKSQPHRAIAARLTLHTPDPATQVATDEAADVAAETRRQG